MCSGNLSNPNAYLPSVVVVVVVVVGEGGGEKLRVVLVV